MIIKTGVDITSISKFERVVERSGQAFLERVFHPSELKKRGVEYLSGVFAAKEAIIKSSIVPIGGWKKIEIVYEKSGRPRAKILDAEILSRVEQLDISISHDGDYAISVAVALLK